ncbi:hypothetical protein ACHQM5_011083 [Ranunculus cassubicifolius]
MATISESDGGNEDLTVLSVESEEITPVDGDTTDNTSPATESTPQIVAESVESTNPSEEVKPVVEDEDFTVGFKRPEMNSESFPKPANPYDRHVFLAFDSALSWPKKVEAAPLSGALNKALKKADIGKKVKFTVIEGDGLSNGDVLIFPEMIKYRNLTAEDVEGFVEDVLVKETISQALGEPEKLSGYYVFVCAHAERDKRCGVCGPVLIDEFKKEIAEKGLTEQVFVSACSDVGGQKYAGNVIIFGANSDEKVMGHWYGYVTPEDVPQLLDKHIGKGEIIGRLWRGEVCNYEEKKDRETDLEPQESSEVPYINGTSLETKGEDFQDSITKESMQNGGSCCQGPDANGFTCCRTEKVDSDVKEAEQKPKQGSNICRKGAGKVSEWFGKIEQADVLVGVAVVGAVATVAVAYSIYRRSG